MTPSSHPVPAIEAVILDLDGTLIDTGGEIATALHRTFDEFGLRHLTQKGVENLIGRGVRSLVQRALQQVEGDGVDVDLATTRFEAHYAQTVGTHAELFPGVLEGLRALFEAGLRLSVVTNKPRFFTEQLLSRLALTDLLAGIVAGDDGFRRKPEGDMLRAACQRMGTAPAASLMLGDSDNDVLAARAAGCPVWCVPYGYNEGRAPETLACDRLVRSVDEAARLLIAAARARA